MFTNPADETIKSLLIKAKRIAIVGLSPNSDKPSHNIGQYLKERGYQIIPVNPSHPEVLGEKSYPDLKSIPGKIDIVDVFRRPETVLPIAEEAVEIGAKAFWLQEGIVNEQAAEKALQGGLTVVMDRCIYVEHLRLIRAEGNK